MYKVAFPLQNWSLDWWGKEKRYFGAKRPSESGQARKHAGVDLIAAAGTPVVAMTSGKVTKVYGEMLCNREKTGDPEEDKNRLCGSGVEIHHPEAPVFGTVLYGEITPAAGIARGTKVTGGQTIGKVAQIFWNKSRKPMLHVEYYPDFTPGDTHVMDAKKGEYQRAATPHDPTRLLQSLFLQAPPTTKA